MIAAAKVRATASAFAVARDLEIYDLQGMCTATMTLITADFYKAMSTHADHAVWQDVYHAKPIQGVAVYLKLTVIDEVLVVSFKEL